MSFWVTFLMSQFDESIRAKDFESIINPKILDFDLKENTPQRGQLCGVF